MHCLGAGFEEPRRQARRVVAAALCVPQADLFGRPEQPVETREISRFRAILRRVLEHEPLSRILGAANSGAWSSLCPPIRSTRGLRPRRSSRQC